MSYVEFGKVIIVIGAVLIVVGIIVTMSGKIPFFGKLPGDISIQKENFSFYFPITTCIVISAILSLLFWLFSKK